MRVSLTRTVLAKPWPALLFCVWLFTSLSASAQSPVERTFSAPVLTVQAALKKLPGGTSGPLPILNGFVVVPAATSLEVYKRPYFECSIRVTSAASGGSKVSVTAKITAWKGDAAHPGYEVLQSNGRIESDLLDRLQEALAEKQSPGVGTKADTLASSGNANSGHPAGKSSESPDISAPMPQFPRAASSATPEQTSVANGAENSALQQEEKSLQELLQNQSHPENLIAVKQDQTPVLQEPSADAKVLFLASAEDEFEILDTNPEWIHVRISGLSRGWLRRSGVEMLDGSEAPATFANALPAPDPPAQAVNNSKLFSVSGEEEGSFPGDWAPLKGKSVKIISIQQAPGTGRITSPQDKMHFAENLFKNEAAEKSSAGLVLIFDAEDGGMIAATRSILDMWRDGALSEQAFWKQCYLDPPEILGSAN